MLHRIQTRIGYGIEMKETALRFLVAFFPNDIAFRSDKNKREPNSIQKRFTRFSRESFYIYKWFSRENKTNNKNNKIYFMTNLSVYFLLLFFFQIRCYFSVTRLPWILCSFYLFIYLFLVNILNANFNSYSLQYNITFYMNFFFLFCSCLNIYIWLCHTDKNELDISLLLTRSSSIAS